MKKQRFAGTVVLLGGLLFMFFGIKEIYVNTVFINRAEKTTGTVTRVIEVNNRSRKRTTYFAPEIQFHTPDGTTKYYLPTSRVSERLTLSLFGTKKFKEGETVSLYYNPGDPGEARIGTFGQLWFASILFIVFGLILGTVGWFIRKN